jgi:hypothetical protein
MPNYRSASFQRTGYAQAAYYDATVAAELSWRVWAYRTTTAISRVDAYYNAVGTGWKAGARGTLIGIR